MRGIARLHNLALAVWRRSGRPSSTSKIINGDNASHGA